MHNSIQHFAGFGINNMEKVVKKFLEEPKNFASFVLGLRDEALNLVLDIISETLTNCNKMIIDSEERKKNWHIVRTDTKQLITSVGTVTFEKTLFKNKKTGKRVYLLDKQLGIEDHERMTEDAEALLLEEAAQTSYKKAGEGISILETVSKQTVKDKVHSLVFPRNDYAGEKKAVDYLYIDADEDHVAMQGTENNHSTIVKMVYVHEGIEPETPGGKRKRLINPHYFCGVYGDKANKKLWDEVYLYLEQHYDLTKVKKIYLNGDGGNWIKAGANLIEGIEYVLDGFHLEKYLLRITRCLRIGETEVRKEILAYIKEDKRAELKNFIRKVTDGTETEADAKRMLESFDYILNNWKAARARVCADEHVLACTAEGHVSHVLSSRMSSRPMAWSPTGMDAMAKLRAYMLNYGNMLELVRLQRKGVPVEDNEIILSAKDMLEVENKSRNRYGKYFDNIQYHLSDQLRKKLWLQHKIALY